MCSAEDFRWETWGEYSRDWDHDSVMQADNAKHRPPSTEGNEVNWGRSTRRF